MLRWKNLAEYHAVQYQNIYRVAAGLEPRNTYFGNKWKMKR